MHKRVSWLSLGLESWIAPVDLELRSLSTSSCSSCTAVCALLALLVTMSRHTQLLPALPCCSMPCMCGCNDTAQWPRPTLRISSGVSGSGMGGETAGGGSRAKTCRHDCVTEQEHFACLAVAAGSVASKGVSQHCFGHSRLAEAALTHLHGCQWLQLCAEIQRTCTPKSMSGWRKGLLLRGRLPGMAGLEAEAERGLAGLLADSLVGVELGSLRAQAKIESPNAGKDVP